MKTILGEIKDNPNAPMNAETLKACIRLWQRRGCPTTKDADELVAIVKRANSAPRKLRKVSKKELGADPYGAVCSVNFVEGSHG